MTFRPGDKVRCISGDDSSCRLKLNDIYTVKSIDGNWLSTDGEDCWKVKRFILADSAADATAELAKINKLLDDCNFAMAGGSTYSRLKDMLVRFAKVQSDQWSNAVKKLEAIE